jgi:Arc/MetJ family transcription regulator
VVKRTTIELDEDLLARAKHALGTRTTRETVEAALRRVADAGDEARRDRAVAQRKYLQIVPTRVHLDELRSEEMWR